LDEKNSISVLCFSLLLRVSSFSNQNLLSGFNAFSIYVINIPWFLLVLLAIITHYRYMGIQCVDIPHVNNIIFLVNDWIYEVMYIMHLLGFSPINSSSVERTNKPRKHRSWIWSTNIIRFFYFLQMPHTLNYWIIILDLEKKYGVFLKFHTLKYVNSFSSWCPLNPSIFPNNPYNLVHVSFGVVQE